MDGYSNVLYVHRPKWHALTHYMKKHTQSVFHTLISYIYTNSYLLPGRERDKDRKTYRGRDRYSMVSGIPLNQNYSNRLPRLVPKHPLNTLEERAVLHYTWGRPCSSGLQTLDQTEIRKRIPAG